MKQTQTCAPAFCPQDKQHTHTWVQGFFSRRKKGAAAEDVEIAEPVDKDQIQVKITDMFMYADTKDKILLGVGYARRT
jgi:hypothetical protein